MIAIILIVLVVSEIFCQIVIDPYVRRLERDRTEAEKYMDSLLDGWK
jgi:hypothetical protein